jgi:hypothetical protein
MVTEALALNRAFRKIKGAEIRAAVISFVESLAARENALRD